MALGQTNITTTLIRNTLVEDNNKVSELCLSTLINMWSRYKPTRGAEGTLTFWKGSDGLCGFSLPTLAGGVWSQANWQYVKPNANYRLGDFRGYEHINTLKPPIYSFIGVNECVIPSVIFPTDSDLVE